MKCGLATLVDSSAAKIPLPCAHQTNAINVGWV